MEAIEFSLRHYNVFADSSSLLCMALLLKFKETPCIEC
jgi:hypothetical protein